MWIEGAVWFTGVWIEARRMAFCWGGKASATIPPDI